MFPLHFALLTDAGNTSTINECIIRRCGLFRYVIHVYNGQLYKKHCGNHFLKGQQGCLYTIHHKLQIQRMNYVASFQTRARHNCDIWLLGAKRSNNKNFCNKITMHNQLLLDVYELVWLRVENTKELSSNPHVCSRRLFYKFWSCFNR